MLRHKQKKVKWDEEKQSWCVSDWMKVILNDESRIYIGQDSHTGIFVSNEMYKDDCLMKQISSSHLWYRIVCHLKGIKVLRKNQTWPASSSDLNPTKNLKWKFKKKWSVRMLYLSKI